MEKTIDYRHDVIIHGMLFRKHLKEGLLKERDKPHNQIVLKNLMDDGLYLTGYVDAFNGTKSFHDPIAPRGNLHQQYLSLNKQIIYGLGILPDEQIQEINTESIQAQRGFQGVDSIINSRLNNMLPQMELLGKAYELNLVKDCLQNVYTHRKGITITGFSPRGPKGEYTFLHVPGSDLLIALNSRTKKIPDGACVVVMDNMLLVDPIGTALKYFLPPTSLLTRFTMQSSPQFRVYQLKDTDIPEQVRCNQLEEENHKNGSLPLKRQKVTRLDNYNRSIRS